MLRFKMHHYYDELVRIANALEDISKQQKKSDDTHIAEVARRSFNEMFAELNRGLDKVAH